LAGLVDSFGFLEQGEVFPVLLGFLVVSCLVLWTLGLSVVLVGLLLGFCLWVLVGFGIGSCITVNPVLDFAVLKLVRLAVFS